MKPYFQRHRQKKISDLAQEVGDVAQEVSDIAKEVGNLARNCKLTSVFELHVHRKFDYVYKALFCA